MRILAVDDYVPLMTLVGAVLDDCPEHEVNTAIDGEEALKKCASGPYDLIILNLRIRNADGLGCLSAIRKLLPLQKVLVLTDDDRAAASLQGLGIRPDSVMVGPLDRSPLAKRIGAALKSRR